MQKIYYENSFIFLFVLMLICNRFGSFKYFLEDCMNNLLIDLADLDLFEVRMKKILVLSIFQKGRSSSFAASCYAVNGNRPRD